MKNGKERRNKEEEFEKITIYSQISTARGKIRLLPWHEEAQATWIYEEAKCSHVS